MSLIRMLSLICLLASPAMADPICRPEPGSPLRVIGVAQNDPLNVRTSAPSGRVIGKIRAGQTDVRATGRVVFLRDSCKLACSQVLGGAIGIAISEAIERDCRSKGRIWYEVTAGRNVKG